MPSIISRIELEGLFVFIRNTTTVPHIASAIGGPLVLASLSPKGEITELQGRLVNIRPGEAGGINFYVKLAFLTGEDADLYILYDELSVVALAGNLELPVVAIEEDASKIVRMMNASDDNALTPEERRRAFICVK